MKTEKAQRNNVKSDIARKNVVREPHANNLLQFNHFKILKDKPVHIGTGVKCFCSLNIETTHFASRLQCPDDVAENVSSTLQ